MKNRSRAAGAATLALMTTGLVGHASAQETLPSMTPLAPFEFCSSGPAGSSCVRFQGYIYVGRGQTAAPAAAADRAAPAANSSLGGERLYIHVEGADAR